MNEPIQFWAVPVEDMTYDQLEEELRLQKWLYSLIKSQLSMEKKAEKNATRYSWIRLNKIDFCDILMKQLDGFIADLETRLKVRKMPSKYSHKHETYIKSKRRAERQKAVNERNSVLTQTKILSEREGVNLQWDKDKFLLVGQDRGYRTEEALTYAVQKELDISYKKAQALVGSGRFTWGQVMLLGAKFEMTPKEFCDIFMSGYFDEYKGGYYASYKNIDRTALLRRRVLPELPKGEDE